MILAKVSNDNYKTTWTLDTIYDDAQRYAWPCNIDFIINYRVKKLFKDEVITKPDFGLRCEKVREMVKKLKD